MNHKLKAEELLKKFMPYAYANTKQDTDYFNRQLISNAKQCAIIAVDEILSLCEDLEMIEYWQEVKKELTI